MSYEIDVAVSPLRDPENTTEWTLEQICKFGWVPKRIKVTYKFGFNAAADQYLYDHWEEFEFTGDETSRVCSPEVWEAVADGGSGDIYWGYDAEESSLSQFALSLGDHGVLPSIFSGGLGFKDDYYMVDSSGPYAFEGNLNRGPYDSDTPVTFTDALEIVTKDNTGADVSFFYDLVGNDNGGDYPFTEPEFAGEPYGFQFGEGDFIRYEVTEWLSYNGTWDTETGELLVADPWNP